MRHLPNFITCLNLLTGAIGCFLLARGDISSPLYLILLAAFFDLMDGLVARQLGVSSAIGKELDSLADMVSFGLFPAYYMTILIASRSEGYIFLVGLLIAVFSALRLAKFNTDDQQTDKFIGLPTPANAIMISTLIFLPESFINFYSLLSITAASCFLLVAPIELLAFKFKNFQWKENSLRYLLLILIVVLLIFFQWKALPLIIPCYILFSIFGNFLTKSSV